MLEIVAAIVARGDRVLVARRPAGSHLGGMWEFPGGKVEPGESATDALARELEEEVGLELARPPLLLHRAAHRYPERSVLIHFYLARDVRGDPHAAEGQELRWATAEELERLETPAANREVIRLLKEQLGEGSAAGP